MQAKDDDNLDEVKAILRRLQRIGTGDEEGTAPAGPERTVLSREGSRRELPRHKTAAPPNGVKSAPSAPQDARVAEVEAGRRSSSRSRKGTFAVVAALLLVGGIGLTFRPKIGGEPQLASPFEKTAELSKAQPTPTATERPRAIAAIPQSDQPQSGAESAINLPAGGVSPASPPALSAENAERISYAQRLIDEGKIVAGRDLLLDGLAERKADAALALARSYDPNSVRLIPNADATADIEQAERWYRRWHEIAASDGLTLDAQRIDRIIKAMR